MTMSDTDDQPDWDRLNSAGEALLHQALLLQAEIGASQAVRAHKTNASVRTVEATHLLFDGRRDSLSAAPVPLVPQKALLPGMVCNFESLEPVVATGQWVMQDDGNGGGVKAYCLAVHDAAATRWFTLEFLVDAAAVKRLGFVALTLKAASAPAVKINTVLRVYRTGGQWTDMPGLTRTLKEASSTFVDGMVLPPDVRDAIDVTQPIRYIVFCPTMSFTLSLLEAVLYPGISEAAEA